LVLGRHYDSLQATKEHSSVGWRENLGRDQEQVLPEAPANMKEILAPLWSIFGEDSFKDNSLQTIENMEEEIVCNRW